MRMPAISNLDLGPILHMAVGPAMLFSGIGFLLLIMTNRLGRVIDLIRDLKNNELGTDGAEERQISVFRLRASLLRSAIMLASFSVLCTTLLIISLFLSALFKADPGWLIPVLFVSDMLFLAGSLILFLKDINKSLSALKLELKGYK